MAQDTYYLQWRGQRLGPWTYEEVRAALLSGDIHSMHQIHVNNAWMLLRDFVEQQESTMLQQNALEIASEVERRREAEKAEANKSQLQKQHRDWKEGGLIRPSPFPEINPPPFSRGTPKSLLESPDPSAPIEPETTRLSWLAATSLICSLGNFVPGVNFVSWIISIATGHLALIEIQREPSITGRGMAIAGLIITYALVIIGITTLLLFRSSLPAGFSLF